MSRLAGGQRVVGGELGQQLRQPGAVVAHIAQLDVLVAAHQVGQPGDLDRPGVVAGGEALGQPGDHVPVLGQQGAFLPPHLGPPERVERGTAQAAHRHQGAEGGPEPRPQADLAPHPKRPQHGRVQPVRVAGTGAELLLDPAGQDGIEGQPGDLVLVLVGGQLEQVGGHRPGQLVAVGDVRLACPHAFDQVRECSRAIRAW